MIELKDYTKEVILSDFKKLQYLYKMKRVIRYDQERDGADVTESVAEHIYGMQVLLVYFTPLEFPNSDINLSKVFEMILFHDIDEIETGDTLGYRKTDADRAKELDAMKFVLKQAPVHMQKTMTERVEEYEKKETNEARFAKALDKIEPLVQIFNEDWKKVLLENKTTPNESLRIKTPYIKDFPYIKKFADVIHEELIAGGYYWTGEDST